LFGIRCAVAVIIISCCSAGWASGAFEPAPCVFYHPVYLRRTPSLPVPAVSRFAGAVTTLPAHLDAPEVAAYDTADGNVYVVDQSGPHGALELLRVSPRGMATRVAAVPATAAYGIAYDPKTDLFYLSVDGPNESPYEFIYAVTPSGRLSVLAGGGAEYSRDGAGRNAGFYDVGGIAYDSANGLLYAVDYASVRVISTAGVVKTLPGSIGQSSGIEGLAYDARRDRLIVALVGGEEIESVSTRTGAVRTIAGRCLVFGRQSQSDCDSDELDGPGNVALFALPSAVAVDPVDGTIYVADQFNNAIRRIDASNNVTTLAGNGIEAERDGAGPAAEFNLPAQLTLDSAHGILYAIDGTPGYPQVDAGTLRSVTTRGATPPPLATPITLFEPAAPDREPLALAWQKTVPASAALSYVEATGYIGTLTRAGLSAEVADPYAGVDAFGPEGIVLGADGSQWYQDVSDGGVLVHHTKAGFAAYLVPGNRGFRQPSPNDLALAPNGDVWFVVNNTLGFITPAGRLTPIANFLKAGPTNSVSLAFVADSSLWVADGAGLLQYSRAGAHLQTLAYPANDVTQGPDGNAWFSEYGTIGTIRPNGELVLYVLPNPCAPQRPCWRGIGAITSGSDGALWFVEQGPVPAIGRLSVDGLLDEFPIPAARSNPTDITPGPDGNIWFADNGAQKLGRVTLARSGRNL